VNTGSAHAGLCNGLSRMKGNFHVRFLGEGAAATPLPYPTKRVANPVFTSKDPVNSGLFAQFYSGFTGTFTGTDTTFLGTPDEL